jgi:predicted small lipoprotein YifL
MKKPMLAVLVLTLAATLAACGNAGPPAAIITGSEIADDTDDGAATLAENTFDMSAAQAQTLGLYLGSLAVTAPTAPVSVTVAVKVGKVGTTNAGLKRAAVSWKLNGKTFPAALTGITSGTYSVALTTAGAALKSKTGTLTVTLPLASGNLDTSRSRSTAYLSVPGVACVSVASTVTVANPAISPAVFGTQAAPLVVCEPVPPTAQPI